jgi:hypothetical protein
MIHFFKEIKNVIYWKLKQLCILTSITKLIVNSYIRGHVHAYNPSLEQGVQQRPHLHRHWLPLCTRWGETNFPPSISIKHQPTQPSIFRAQKLLMKSSSGWVSSGIFVCEYVARYLSHIPPWMQGCRVALYTPKT